MVVEGQRLVQEALRSALPITEAFYTHAFTESVPAQALVSALCRRGVSCWQVTPELMEAISDTETPQGVLVVMPLPEMLPSPRDTLTLIPDSIRDPGNLGTMLRTAWAADVSQVLLPPGNVDFTNPKVVRAGMGAHFFLPIRKVEWEEVRAFVVDAPVWLAEAGAGTPYEQVNWQAATALIIGGEAEGAGPEARALAEGRHVYIPMARGVDSLNAAIATAVLLFETARQRRAKDVR